MTGRKEGQINENTLTNEIADIVRERILKGEYQIGEKIKESSIAQELNVSRTPIREAFKTLEEEGLLDYLPNRGCYAKGFTKRDVSDIYTVREALEEIAMTWACERITDEEIDKLEEQCELMDFYTKKRDVQKILTMNSSFHDIIYNSTGSRFLAQVLRSYKGYLDKTRKSVFYREEFLDSIQEEHKAIFEAVKSRDKEQAVIA
ncbi:MAG: GntR family transcriptional regulator, partial [Firmicutes bacterium]|nr:GntR family transcriptional regulator [Bacillota bacterium]